MLNKCGNYILHVLLQLQLDKNFLQKFIFEILVSSIIFYLNN